MPSYLHLKILFNYLIISVLTQKPLLYILGHNSVSHSSFNYFKVFIEFVTALFLFSIFCFAHKACGILAPRTGAELIFSIMEGCFNHWTARAVPILFRFFCLKCLNFSHWKLFQIVFCVPLTYSKPFVFYCMFPYFKEPKDVIGLFAYSMASSKTAISTRTPVPFIGKWY